jgi:hypothetical protein
MKDPAFAAAYYERKDARTEKRRASSRFEYASAGGEYIPTQTQYDFCLKHYNLFETEYESLAADMIMSAYVLNEKTPHDYIHVVNEKMRQYD